MNSLSNTNEEQFRGETSVKDINEVQNDEVAVDSSLAEDMH